MFEHVYTSLSRPIWVGHICSNCCKPALTAAQIRVTAGTRNRFDLQKAGHDSIRLAENAVAREIVRIETSGKEFYTITPENRQNNNQADSSFRFGFIDNIDAPCPHCGHQEPWQTSQPPHRMAQLKKQNFPTVFTDPATAHTWLTQFDPQAHAPKTNFREETETFVHTPVVGIGNTYPLRLDSRLPTGSPRLLALLFPALALLFCLSALYCTLHFIFSNDPLHMFYGMTSLFFTILFTFLYTIPWIKDRPAFSKQYWKGALLTLVLYIFLISFFYKGIPYHYY